jgi:hypothetical protein
MGPRSNNRGYGNMREAKVDPEFMLQWVHGRITVVMSRCPYQLHDNKLGPELREGSSGDLANCSFAVQASAVVLVPSMVATRERG